jgi:hypothetical protein
MWVPVHEALPTVNFAVVVQLDEHLQHSVVEVAVILRGRGRGRTGHGER